VPGDAVRHRPGDLTVHPGGGQPSFGITNLRRLVRGEQSETMPLGEQAAGEIAVAVVSAGEPLARYFSGQLGA
jgi:hypothetical protein